MSNIAPGEKVISHFDQQGSVQLRAVLKRDTLVTSLSNQLPSLRLYEVWILPEEAEAFLPQILDRTAFNTLAEMLIHYDMNRSFPSHHAAGRLSNLLGEFGVNMSFAEAATHVSVIDTNHGPVISYVLGQKKALEKVYEQHLRVRPEPLSVPDFENSGY